jgi:hypothetical protein
MALAFIEAKREAPAFHILFQHMDKTEHADHPNSVLVNAIKFFELSAQIPASPDLR